MCHGMLVAARRGRESEVGGAEIRRRVKARTLQKTEACGIWPHAAMVVFSVLKGSSIEAVRGATTRSCFRLGIPSGHSSGSHSTARAISFTRHFPAATGVEGASNRPRGLF